MCINIVVDSVPFDNFGDFLLLNLILGIINAQIYHCPIFRLSPDFWFYLSWDQSKDIAMAVDGRLKFSKIGMFVSVWFNLLMILVISWWLQNMEFQSSVKTSGNSQILLKNRGIFNVITFFCICKTLSHITMDNRPLTVQLNFNRRNQKKFLLKTLQIKIYFIFDRMIFSKHK